MSKRQATSPPNEPCDLKRTSLQTRLHSERRQQQWQNFAKTQATAWTDEHIQYLGCSFKDRNLEQQPELSYQEFVNLVTKNKIRGDIHLLVLESFGCMKGNFIVTGPSSEIVRFLKASQFTKLSWEGIGVGELQFEIRGEFLDHVSTEAVFVDKVSTRKPCLAVVHLNDLPARDQQKASTKKSESDIRAEQSDHQTYAQSVPDAVIRHPYIAAILIALADAQSYYAKQVCHSFKVGVIAIASDAWDDIENDFENDFFLYTAEISEEFLASLQELDRDTSAGFEILVRRIPRGKGRRRMDLEIRKALDLNEAPWRTIFEDHRPRKAKRKAALARKRASRKEERPPLENQQRDGLTAQRAISPER